MDECEALGGGIAEGFLLELAVPAEVGGLPGVRRCRLTLSDSS